MENPSKTPPSVSSSESLSKHSESLKDLSIESGSLETLIKLALREFDENGCIVHPPAVTIVLLTMHRWFSTSHDFFEKVVEIYQKTKGQNTDSAPNETLEDCVFEGASSFNEHNRDGDSVILTRIAEIGEPSDEVSEKNDHQESGVTIPSICVNGIAQTTAAGNLEKASIRSDEMAGDSVEVVDELTGPSVRHERRVNGDNNNETSQLVSTESGPTFDAVAVDEPYLVTQAHPADDVSMEMVPKVKVTCVQEEFSQHKSKNGPIDEDEKKPSVSQYTEDVSMYSVSEDVSNYESSDAQVINMWIVCQFLNYWMSKFGRELRTNENVLFDITQFKKSLINENQAYEKMIKHLIGRSVVGTGELSGHSTRLVRQREVVRAKSLAFKDLSPKDIAEQLTHIDCRSLKKIPMTEWKTYTRKSKLIDVPNLERYVMRFNGLSRWIEAMVLNGETHEIRAHVIEKFLNVAQCLRNHQNFNSLMAVIGALNHSALRRLHQTVAVLNENKKQFLHEMTDFLSSEGNYANYRRELAKCKGFCVPILGVHLKDLIAVDTALPDYISGKKLINFQKMGRFYTVIATLMNFKNMQPPAASKFELINMLRLSIQMTITEDELYELSYAREPRRASCISNTDKTVHPDSQLFADWASGRAPSPDSKTIDRHVTSMVEAVFKFYDRDSDGLLTTDDFEAISTNFPFVDSFGVVDADCDGVVTKEEMKNYFLKANYRALGRDFTHNFQETTYLTPNFCGHCGGVLWGLIKQGFKCKDCGINCHKACKGQVVIDCRSKTLSPASPNAFNASTLERASNKADAIRYKWKNKRKSRIMGQNQNSEPDTSKNEEGGGDEVDAISTRLEKSDEACKVLLDENKRLKDENDKLNNDATEANQRIRNLEARLKLVRQETITFVLEQLDALQLRRNTAV